MSFKDSLKESLAYLKRTAVLKALVTVLFIIGYIGTLKITENNDEA